MQAEAVKSSSNGPGALAVQRDDKIVGGGGSCRGFSVSRSRPNGSSDTTFGGKGGVSVDFSGNGNVYDVAFSGRHSCHLSDSHKPRLHRG